ncbi:HK97 family phage prohead protease [Rhizobium sp. LjRoot30]|uniref:HK97 family phage prohead protease n=1 Tax=Rhizobium sp. LjRoot30 TaxID=3342320 RepID=UPI003ECE8569
MKIFVQGYALPWDRPAFVDGLVETVAPCAVAAQTPRNIRMLYGSHAEEGQRVYAQTRDGTLQFFQDDYGLGFYAALDDASPAVRSAARAIGSGMVSQCSVNFVNMSRREDGRVIWAAIDHVALVAQGAYSDTACWLADTPINQRHEDVRAHSLMWIEGFLNHSRRRGAAGQGLDIPASNRPLLASAPRSRPSVPESVRNLLDDPTYQAWARESARLLKDHRDKMRREL